MAVSLDETASSPNGFNMPATSSKFPCLASLAQSSRSDSRASTLCWLTVDCCHLLLKRSGKENWHNDDQCQKPCEDSFHLGLAAFL
ncbi:hypothetical protein AKJ16_DCAP03519, partial [Drosera capensis]